MEKGIDFASQSLRDAAVDLIVFACTSGSLVKGFGYDLQLAKQITDVACCPAITTSWAVVEALKKMNIHRISLVTLYVQEVTDKEVSFLEENCFTIVKTQFLGIKSNLKIGNLESDDALVLIKSTNSIDTEAVFISCTNFATFEVIYYLEEKLHKPVISSNSATLWAALITLKIKPQIRLGSLFDAQTSFFERSL